MIRNCFTFVCDRLGLEGVREDNVIERITHMRTDWRPVSREKAVQCANAGVTVVVHLGNLHIGLLTKNGTVEHYDTKTNSVLRTPLWKFGYQAAKCYIHKDSVCE